MKNRIKDLRNERNLTLRDLAEYIGINYSTIACYETEKREPNIETLKKLTSFFEVSLDYICGDNKYIYCLYENGNYEFSINETTYNELKDYIYFNTYNKRCVNINKYLGIDNNNNVIDLLNEFYTITQIDLLFDNKNHSIEEFNNAKNQDIILSKIFLDKVKSII